MKEMLNHIIKFNIQRASAHVVLIHFLTKDLPNAVNAKPLSTRSQPINLLPLN